MNTAVISLAVALVQVGVVYVGINTYNLDIWRMGAAFVALSFFGSLLMHQVAPPSQIFQHMKARISNRPSTLNIAEFGLIDVIGLVFGIAISYMLITRYGLGPWFGIYVAASIASLTAYFL